MDSWEDVDRTEVFSFEGHSTEVALLGRKVIAQLLAIDQDRAFPSNLRQPTANEFNTLNH